MMFKFLITLTKKVYPMKKFTLFINTFLISLFALTQLTLADERPFITVASTTSTQNSGLFEHILPIYSDTAGIDVHVVAVGTGAAIRLAKKGDADVLLVHHKPSEIAFIDEGFGVKRFDLMYNDFVVVGPKADPAQIKGSTSILKALSKIASSKSTFASRGDDSGTHKKELGLWKAADITPVSSETSWYRETGSGMGATLNVAAGMDAYALTDRATWLSFANKADLAILFEGDERLFNQYGVMLVNQDKHAHIKTTEGQNFIDWLLSSAGQKTIADFKVSGTQLFYPNAK